MIIKCRNCGGALAFDAISGKMKCDFCDSLFEMEETEQARQEAEQLEKAEKEAREAFYGDESDTMDCNVLSCTSCGAQLMVNSVETATFCAYCGQPTIVFDRVSKMLKPKKIIPFRVTKEQAVNAIREKFQKGFFVPDEIKNFEVERVVGIYVPYWLYDITYYDRQKLRGKVGKNNYRNFYREAESDFNHLTIDASSNFCDESSQRLEPYWMNELKDFESGYLSGFYADRYDQNSKELSNLAVGRCRELFNEQVEKSINATNITLKESNPKWTIKEQVYAMLPAWFMTIRYEDKPYTMLVNGQTGKVVGAVPFKKKKVSAVFMTIFIVLSVFLGPIGAGIVESNWMYGSDSGDFFESIFTYLIILGVIFFSGFRTKCRIEENITRTSAKEMNDFAGSRQEGDM